MAIPAMVVGVPNFDKRITDGRSVFISQRSFHLDGRSIATGTTGGDAGHVPLMGPHDIASWHNRNKALSRHAWDQAQRFARGPLIRGVVSWANAKLASKLGHLSCPFSSRNRQRRASHLPQP